MAGERWLFTRSQLVNTPSRKCGIDSDKELNYRQQAANFIQDMGQRLQVTQLCINTAIVYLHRFYMFHSLTKFHRNSIASACLFLAAKVEEQPRKLEHVIKVAHMCLHREAGPLDTKSEQYLEQAQELVVNENILLQSLGFEITVDHPNSHVVKTCTLVRASKDLAQTSYFLATNSLHLTTFCIQYPPTVVACVCIHLACKWSKWELPQSREGKDWWWYTDRSVTLELLEGLTQEFLSILEKCPSKLKRKINAFKHGGDRKDLDMPNYKEPAPLSTPSPWKSREPSATITSATSGETAPQQMTTPSSIQHPTATNHDRQAAGVASQHPVPREPPSFQPPDVAPKPKLGASVGPPEGLRRVRTEPALTAREYLERKERERQAAAAAHSAAHNSQADHKGEPHHMDNIFNLMKEKPPAEPNNTQVSKEQSQMQDRHARERLNPVQSRDKLSELPQGRHSRPEHGHDKHTVDLHGVKDKMPDQSQSKDRSRSDRGRPHGPRDKHRGEHSRERHHAEQSEHAQRAGSAQKTMPAVSEASTRSPLKLSISLNRDRDKHLSVRESASSKLVELNADGGVRQNTHMSSASQDASAAHISPSKHGRAGPGLGAGPTKSGAPGEEGAGEYVSTPPASGGSLKLRISKDMLSSSGHKEKHRHSGSRHSSSKSHSGSRADKDKSSRKRPRSPIEKIKLNLSAIQGQHTPNKLQRTADGPAFSSGPPRDPYALEQDILSPSQAANGSRTNSPQGQTPGPNMTDVQRTLQKLIDIQKANLALKTCQTAGSIGTPMSMPMGGTMERGIGQYAYHSMYADPNLALGMVMPGSAPPPPPPPPPSEPPPVPPPPPPE